MRTLIFRTAAPYLTALMLLFSIFVLLRGHNEPGGGFIGGLIAVSAFAIHGIAFGVHQVRRAIVFPPDGDFRVRPAAGGAGRARLAAGRRAAADRALGVADHRRHQPSTCRRCCCSTSASTWSSSARSRRLRWRLKAGRTPDGDRVFRSGRAVLRRRDLSDPVEARHSHPARHRHLQQRREPADLHQRPHRPLDARRSSRWAIMSCRRVPPTRCRRP